MHAVSIFMLLLYHSYGASPEQMQKCLDNCTKANETFQAIVCAYNANDTVHPDTYLVGSSKESALCAWIECGIAVIHAGRCGCPNNCFTDQSHGVCWEGTCQCNGLWTGPDCSILDCPNDICSMHGTCIPRNGTTPPYCSCKEGWTGYYCSQPIVRTNQYPFGMYHFGKDDFYYLDQYQDHHPIFNRSEVGVLFMEVDEQAYRNMILPENIYKDEPISANLTMLNWRLYKDKAVPVPVGLTVYGQTSRTTFKKSFEINFEEMFYGVKNVYLKAASDYSLQTQSLTYDLLRAVSVPIQRAGWVRVYVNNISFGLYVIQETHDQEWVKTYFPDSTGGLLKGSYRADLVYRGENLSFYKQARFTDYKGLLSIPVYEPVHGAFNWTKLVELMKILDPVITPEEEFERRIQEIFNIDLYFRVLVIDIFTTNYNSYSCQSNLYLLYDNPSTGKFDFLGDGYLRWNYGDNSIPEPAGGWEYVDPYTWCNFTVFPERNPVQAPLSSRLLANPFLRTKFEKTFRIFLDDIYKPIGNRLESVTEMLSHEHEYDRFTKVMLPSYEARVSIRIEEIGKFLDSRWNELKARIPLFISDQLMWLILVPIGLVMIGPIVTVVRCLKLRGADDNDGEQQKLLKWVPK